LTSTNRPERQAATKSNDAPGKPTTKSQRRAAKPQGREENIAALVRAAEELFTEHGPANVSLRKIAERAGVNYGLLYQYVGTRDDLLRLVYRTLSENAAANIRGAEDFSSGLAAMRSRGPGTYQRLLAWTLLEGHDPHSFLGLSPAMQELVKSTAHELEVKGYDGVDATVVVGLAMVIDMGWRMFGEFWIAALGLDGRREEFERVLARLVDQLPEVLATLDRP
jgi:AcrR family transcriptional regulator